MAGERWPTDGQISTLIKVDARGWKKCGRSWSAGELIRIRAEGTAYGNKQIKKGTRDIIEHIYPADRPAQRTFCGR